MARYFRRPAVGLLFNLAASVACFLFAAALMGNAEILAAPIEIFMRVASDFGRWVGELMISALGLEPPVTG